MPEAPPAATRQPRICARCGRPIPPGAKLAQASAASGELCLACRIQISEAAKEQHR